MITPYIQGRDSFSGYREIKTMIENCVKDKLHIVSDSDTGIRKLCTY